MIKKWILTIVCIATLIVAIQTNPKETFASEILGTKENPYLISTYEELVEITKDLKSSYKLTKDIDLENKPCLPIGETYNNPFTGNFDGNGFIIKNLKMDMKASPALGLFGYVDSGILENITIENISVDGYFNVGGLVGYIQNGKILNSKIVGTGSIKGKNSVGGFVGTSINTKIERCFVTINVTGVNYVGGLVGTATGNNLDNGILNCYTNNNVILESGYAGSLVGNAKNLKIANSYATGEIIGNTYGSEKGLVGYFDNTSTIANSYFDNTISNTGNIKEGRTKLELKTEENYMFWDFSNVWELKPEEYPTIKYLIDIKESVEEMSGEGTIDNPYLIKTKDNLASIKNDLTASYKLINDIDFEKNFWIPVGDNKAYFTGNFDGNGYIIKNILILENSTNNVGFFGYVDGSTIKNMNIENIYTVGYENVGGIAGTIKNAKIINSTVLGIGSINGQVTVGGIVGYMENSNIERSFSSIKVIGNQKVGGLIGQSATTKTSTIYNSYAINDLEIKASYVGGLVGVGSNISIINSYYSGKILGSKDIGGIFGSSGMNIEIIDSYFNSTSTKISTPLELARTEEQLKSQETFQNWKFETTWELKEGSLPTLIYKLEEAPEIYEEMLGDGTPENPFIIKNKPQFMKVKDNMTASYKLNSDIDFENDLWNPIGTDLTPFKGSFDGNGHVIKNFQSLHPKNTNVGLFGYISGSVIKNITIENLNISGNYYVGGLVGYAKNSEITNVSIKGTGSVNAKSTVGGISGQSENTNFHRVSTEININAQSNAGGLVGIVQGSTNTIENSFSNSNIVATVGYAGGFVGTPSGLNITNSYSTSRVSAPKFVGGLIADRAYSVVVKNSYFDSTISKIEKPITQARTTEQLKNKETFVDWNFENIWTIKDGVKSPTFDIGSKPVSPNIQKGTATYVYDKVGRLKEVTYENGQKIIYKYDLAGNILSIEILN